MENAVLKIKPELNLADSSFNPAHTARYTLSVQLGADNWSCAVFDTGTDPDTCLAFQVFSFGHFQDSRQLEEKFTRLHRSGTLLQGSYRETVVSIVEPRSALIPADYFIREEAADYFSFNHTLKDGEEVLYDFVNAGSTYNVYPVPGNLLDSLRTLMPGARILHFSTVLLESLLRHREMIRRKRVFLHVSRSHFEIVVTDAGKLLFYNCFKSGAEQDFLYFVLAAYDQLRLSLRSVPLTLLGEAGEDLQDILSAHVSYVWKGMESSSCMHSFGSDLSPVRYFGLLNQHQCVL
jgi:hypothetical protein